MKSNTLLGFSLLACVVAAVIGFRVVDAATAVQGKRALPVFTVDPAWPKLPNNWVLGNVPGIAVDRRNHVWILHRPSTVSESQRAQAAPPVIEFDEKGTFVAAWGGAGQGFDWPRSEHGIFVDYQGNVWITGSGPLAPSSTQSSDDMIIKFTSQGKFLLQIGGAATSRGNMDTGNLNKPADVFVHEKTHELFVADGYGNRRLIVFDADTGAFKRMWTAFGNAPADVPPTSAAAAEPGLGPSREPLETAGPGPQQFGNPVHAVKVSNDGMVYVADRANRRIQVFTIDGKYVNQVFINRSGPAPHSVSGLALSADAEQRFLYAADYGNSRIAVLDRKDLTVLYQFGGLGQQPGQFRGPHHVAANSRGDLYVAEVAPGNRVQRFAFRGLATKAPANAFKGTYGMVERWPNFAGLRSAAAIGIIPDDQGGLWLLHRSEPAIIHFDASGQILQRFGEGVFVQAHGFCRDRDGNFWAGDSGPFMDGPATAGRGFQMFKFSPEGKLLLTLGKAGVSKAGADTFVGPTACAIAPNGDIVIADGHWPRPASAQQDGDRIVRYTAQGKFVASYGKLGSASGEFMGPHALAFDSRGRLFVADRSNSRVQLFDRNMKFITEWRQFGRPSGVVVLDDDTLIVSDSESGRAIPGPPQAPEGGDADVIRNPGGTTGIRIGNARTGVVQDFIPGTEPEGLGADSAGNIFAGLSGGCAASKSGGCLQKFVRQ